MRRSMRCVGGARAPRVQPRGTGTSSLRAYECARAAAASAARGTLASVRQKTAERMAGAGDVKQGWQAPQGREGVYIQRMAGPGL
jgi:hypothetical protein